MWMGLLGTFYSEALNGLSSDLCCSGLSYMKTTLVCKGIWTGSDVLHVMSCQVTTMIIRYVPGGDVIEDTVR